MSTEVSATATSLNYVISRHWLRRVLPHQNSKSVWTFKWTVTSSCRSSSSSRRHVRRTYTSSDIAHTPLRPWAVETRYLSRRSSSHRREEHAMTWTAQYHRHRHRYRRLNQSNQEDVFQCRAIANYHDPRRHVVADLSSSSADMRLFYAKVLLLFYSSEHRQLNVR